MLNPSNVKYFKATVSKIRKDTTSEISACCPLCGDTKYRLHLVNVPQENYDYVRCFNSGCSVEEPTSVMNYLYHANGDVQGYRRETLNEKIETIKQEKSLQDVLNEVKLKKAPETLEKEIPKVLLDRFTKCTDSEPCMEYLQKRGIEPHYDWMFSEDDFFTYNKKSVYLKNYLIIPVYNSNMKYRGFYSRSIEEKRFSTFLLPDTEKLWALNPTELPQIITEGILDAVCIALGRGIENTGAMLGADVSEEYRATLPKNTIFAFDNDATGVSKAIKYSKMGFSVYVPPEIQEKDFNEMLLNGYTKKMIRDTILENTYSGIQAETRLLMKER